MTSFLQAVRQVLNSLLAVLIFLFNGLAFQCCVQTIAFAKNKVSNTTFSLTFRITVTYLFIFLSFFC